MGLLDPHWPQMVAKSFSTTTCGGNALDRHAMPWGKVHSLNCTWELCSESIRLRHSTFITMFWRLASEDCCLADMNWTDGATTKREGWRTTID